MSKYQLIGIDKDERSIVRRSLHQWSKADEQVILPLLVALQQGQFLTNVQLTEPRWEINVYPLYYWVYHQKPVPKEVYECVFHSFRSVPEEKLRKHIDRIANSEIDILIEDIEYFAFIEAKIVPERGKVKFENKDGVHQLVRQYVQGQILSALIDKTFVLATLGANNAQPIEIQLNETEQELIRLIGEERQQLKVPDFPWTIMRITDQPDETSSSAPQDQKH
jgi:hypothetical protein